MTWKAFVGGAVTVLALEGLAALVALEALRVGATLVTVPIGGPGSLATEPALDRTPWDRTPVRPDAPLSSAVVPDLEEARP